MNTLYKIALTFIIIGAINWGMIGLFSVNLVSLLFGDNTFLTNFIYSIVGICGLISCELLLQPFDEMPHRKH